MTTTTTKTNNEFFSGSNAGNVVFAYRVPAIIITTTGTVGIGFDGTNFQTLVAGTYHFTHINAKTIYFNGSGTWMGWGLGL